MALISDTYSQLNAELHARERDYGASGTKWAPLVDDLATRMGAQTILDYGCGKATLARHLKCGAMVLHYDPAVPEYAAMPAPADFVVSLDVLEHIEPDCLDDVLNHIKSVTKNMAMLAIATAPSKRFLADGRNTHLIVENPQWWVAKAQEIFSKVQAQSNADPTEGVVLFLNP